MHVIKIGFTPTVSQCAGRVASYVLHSHASSRATAAWRPASDVAQIDVDRLDRLKRRS